MSNGRGGKRAGAGRKPGVNVTVRVTLPREVWADLEAQAARDGTTPGLLLSAAYRNQATQPVAVTVADERPALSLEGVTALRVLSAVIDQRTRNGWRWDKERYAALEQHLAQGDVIRLTRQNSKNIWRTAQGDAVRPSVLLKLLESGNVAPLS